MKKLFNSLPFRLLAGVVIGILVGLMANEAFMNIIVTVKQLLGELITFCVPLIVIGFIAPSITRLGKNASRMLMVADPCLRIFCRCRSREHGCRIQHHSAPFHRIHC